MNQNKKIKSPMKQNKIGSPITQKNRSTYVTRNPKLKKKSPIKQKYLESTLISVFVNNSNCFFI